MAKIISLTVANQKVMKALQKETMKKAEAYDSDFGDDLAYAFEEYIEALDIEPRADEILVYDTQICDAKLVKLSGLCFDDIDLINTGKYIVIKNREAYDEYLGRLFINDDVFADAHRSSDIPRCFDQNGEECFPFNYSDTPSDENEDDSDDFLTDYDYFDHIDNNADSYNGFLIKNYFHKNVPGYIYTLILSLMALNYEVNNDNDKEFVAKYVCGALMEKLELPPEKFEPRYGKMVANAIYDVENLIYSLRFKSLADEAIDEFHLFYGDAAFSFFANIFANSIFNPYVTQDSTTYDFKSVI